MTLPRSHREVAKLDLGPLATNLSPVFPSTQPLWIKADIKHLLFAKKVTHLAWCSEAQRKERLREVQCSG